VSLHKKSRHKQNGNLRNKELIDISSNDEIFNSKIEEKFTNLHLKTLVIQLTYIVKVKYLKTKNKYCKGRNISFKNRNAKENGTYNL